MKKVSDKKRFAKTICALSVASVMAIGLPVTVAAANAALSGADKAEATMSAKIESVREPVIKTVVLDINGEKRAVLFNGGTVAEFLESNGVKAGKNQIVIPALNTKITGDTIVMVRDAKPVEVTADGKTRTMVLSLGNVTESLQLAGVALGSEDILSVKRDAKVEGIDKLTIRRVTYSRVTETAAIPFEKVSENSDKVELGETKVSVKGQDGEKKIIKKVKYIDGKAASEEVISETVTKNPVNEVTLIGTKGAGTTGGAGTFTDSNGVSVSYKEVLTGSGTAYTAPAGASTATGVPAYHGGVAVNPDLIPYGSKLYVESTDGSFVYGYCTAVDTGGALEDGSAIVDVFYDTYDECVNWGRRDVNVYVIG